ncbi:hypothetical protein [Alkaliphilus peptidifermentans]|uniref:Uncharacterized protein n=1 Tax=Alkaliphilus peptidifermentans DSM 18978 TaxID=1120976 RepID=A0A1G5IC79_9FIRM|nr:hypothetical protein [Alkaliphilus peptidifermentans]SCY73594.1 hypothetical protein SAMN03080606_02335 [Alkaliphilus peptidifermentans DSM 18978]
MESNKILSSDVEGILNSIPGVLSTKVVFNDSEDIEELHVISTTGRNPKQISRDIQSIIFAKYGLNFDHKKISIAQIDALEKIKAEKRIEIEEIFYTVNGNELKVGVKLKRNDTVYTGIDESLNTTNNSYRVIANATLKALQQVVSEYCFFSTEDVEIISIGKKEVAVAAICFVSGSHEEMLVGTATVKGDLRTAVVKATLDAVNRRLISLVCD